MKTEISSKLSVVDKNTGNSLTKLSVVDKNTGNSLANGQRDLVSIPGRVIPKTLKMVLDTSLLNTQQYKVRIKGKVEQSWERSSVLPYTLV